MNWDKGEFYSERLHGEEKAAKDGTLWTTWWNRDISY